MMNTKEEVKALWKLCFNDSDAFVEFYFRERYSDKVNMVFRKHRKIVSALQHIPYLMGFPHGTLQAAYISGACTHPAYRGKGYMKQLLHKTLQKAFNDDIALSFLIPANDELYRYYNHCGYANAFFRREFREAVSSDISAPGLINIEYTNRFSPALFDYFSHRYNTRMYCVRHSLNDFRIILQDMKISEGIIAVTRDKTLHITGMLFGYAMGDCFNIPECIADNDRISRRLCNDAALHFGCKAYVHYKSATDVHHGEVFGMARIIDAKATVTCFAETHPDKSIDFQLIDDIIPSNNGYYEIADGTVRFSDQPIRKESLTLTPTELGELLFASPGLYMSLMLE